MLPFPYDEINITPATIRYAFDKHENIICIEHGDLGSINISDILTRIIQDTGRFVERWASDCLITIDHINSLAKTTYKLEQEIDEIYCLGLRRDGVDHNSYIMNTLMKNQRGYLDCFTSAEPYYRRVLAVRVHVWLDEEFHSVRVECTLKDLTSSFSRINKADLDENGKLIPSPYKNGNPVPIDPYKKPEPKEDNKGGTV